MRWLGQSRWPILRGWAASLGVSLITATSPLAAAESSSQNATIWQDRAAVASVPDTGATAAAWAGAEPPPAGQRFSEWARASEAEPAWTVAADALFLHRSDAQRAGILYDLTGNVVGNEVLGTANLGLGTQAGPRLILLRELDSDWLLDLEYFEIDGWGGEAQPAPGTYLVIGDESRTGPPANNIDFAYASRLRTAEVNLRLSDWGWIQPLAGFRWIGLNETYQGIGSFDDNGTTIPYTLTYRTRNNLYGGQLGANVALWDRGGPLTITSLNKAGLYLSDAQNLGSYSSSAGNPSQNLSGAGHTVGTAFFGEIGVMLNWSVGEHLSLRGGYQLYWLSGAALAPNQPNSTDLVFGTGGIDNSGSIFMHGPSAGLQLDW